MRYIDTAYDAPHCAANAPPSDFYLAYHQIYPQNASMAYIKAISLALGYVCLDCIQCFKSGAVFCGEAPPRDSAVESGGGRGYRGTAMAGRADCGVRITN